MTDVFEQGRIVGSVAQIQDDASLSAIEVQEDRAELLAVAIADAADDVAARLLDLHDVGSEFGHQFSGVGTHDGG